MWTGLGCDICSVYFHFYLQVCLRSLLFGINYHALMKPSGLRRLLLCAWSKDTRSFARSFPFHSFFLRSNALLRNGPWYTLNSWYGLNIGMVVTAQCTLRPASHSLLPCMCVGFLEWEMAIDFSVSHQEEADDYNDPVNVV